MFGSITLDIVIGLLLVFLLYSLLVTIIGEIVSSMLGLRARMLRKSIERMLNDDITPEKMQLAEETKGGKQKLKVLTGKKGPTLKSKLKFFLWFLTGSYRLSRYKNFSGTFAGKFYNNPSMKYLASGRKLGLFGLRYGKPSYITKENFSETLIHLLRNNAPLDKNQAAINTALETNTLKIDNTTLEIDDNTLLHIRNLWNDAAYNIEDFKKKLEQWFDNTMDRATGWYKRRIKVILFSLGFFLAVAFNVDSIQIVRILSKDKDARSQLVTLGVALAKDTSRYSKAVIEGDTSLGKEVIDSAFQKVKRDIGESNQILALGWHLDKLTNACTDTMKRSLNDKEVDFKKLDSVFPVITKLLVEIKKDEDSLEKITINLNKITDSLLAHTDPAKKKKDLTMIADENENKKIWLGRQQDATDSLNKMQDAFLSAADLHYASVSNIVASPAYYVVNGKKHYSATQKVCYIASRSWAHKQAFLGFLITALAISLGAPFWFDLLKNLVAIRNTGIKPEEKKTT